MNDAAFVFKNDVRERKLLTYGARHKKNGSKSKKCSLPSDKMTKREWKERNGKVESYNLSKPMDWKTFKTLLPVPQMEYLNTLAENGATIKGAAEMFGRSYNTLWDFLKKNFPDTDFFRGGKLKDTAKWYAFLHGDERQETGETAPENEENLADNGNDVESATGCEPNKSAEKKETVSQKDILQINGGTLRLTGIPEAVFAKALMVLDNSERYSFTISFQSGEESVLTD